MGLDISISHDLTYEIIIIIITNILEQVVFDIQQNLNPGVQEMAQPRNNINNTEDTTMDNEIVPSSQIGYEDDIPKMVKDSMVIVDVIYEPNDNEQEIIKM